MSTSSAASSSAASASASTPGATARITSTLRTPCRMASTRREVEPEARAQHAPLPLDDHGTRVHERAVEVEQQRRRHTSIRAALRATPKVVSLDVAEIVAVGVQRQWTDAVHAHVVHVVQVGEQLVRAARLAAGDEQLRRVAREVAPAHVARHDHVEPALEGRKRRELEREPGPTKLHGCTLAAKTLTPSRNHAAAEADVELRLAEVAAQQRAHDLRREVGIAPPPAPRPPRRRRRGGRPVRRRRRRRRTRSAAR